MPDPTDQPPDKEKVRIPRSTCDALRAILTLSTLLYPCGTNC